MYYIFYDDCHISQSFQPAYYLKVAKRRVKALAEKLKLPIENFRIVRLT